MAGRPIVIEFASNVRDYLRGTRDVERSTDDIGESLKDASKDADRFEREFRDSMRDAERQADKSARKIEQDFDRAGTSIGDAGEEISGEFQQNLAEGLSSGNLQDVAQSTAGGLVSAFKGPVGWAAGAMAGVVALAFQDIAEKAQVWKDALDSMIADMRAERDAITGELSNFDKLQQFNQFLKDNPEYVKATRMEANLAKVSFDEVAYAIRFGGEEQDRVVAKLHETITAAGAVRDEQGKITGNIDGSVIAADRLLRKIEDSEQAMSDEEKHARDVGEAIDFASRKLADNYNPMLATIEERWNRIRSAVDDLSKGRRTAWIEFRATGNAAAYVTRGNANYSPAYVAVDNIHKSGG